MSILVAWKLTLQGADILAYSDSASPCQVFIPDCFNDNTANIDWMPPDNEEKQKALGEWFGNAHPPTHLPKVNGFLEAAEAAHKGIKQWAVVGYCWGGKMTNLLAGEGTRFEAAVQTSSAMVDPTEAKSVTIPTMILASKEEPKDAVEEYVANLVVSRHVETFGDQVHGFMGARADLADANVKKEYERGYQLVLQFLHEQTK
ncbi:hypothetical protein LTS08_006082 [Lithohypha guttulata]|uniref:uncharacterized protein n=1 Tax=Lithohypha guttulata TaxID=1690604 RepID=UPI002DDE4B23|nr:hypothetical protein LTS08_006082 [Lithohypha guttulata]